MEFQIIQFLTSLAACQSSVVLCTALHPMAPSLNPDRAQLYSTFREEENEFHAIRSLLYQWLVKSDIPFLRLEWNLKNIR